MSGTAGVRPAVTRRAVGLLVAYLVFFPPLFVLAPLAGLLIASRPRTVREWIWIGAAGLWLVATLNARSGPESRVLHAWALFLTAGFVVLMLFGRLRPALAGVTASVFAFGAVSVWSWLLGTRWRDLELAVIRAGWEFCRQLLEQANLSPDRAAGLKTYVDLLAESMPAVAQLLPALLVLSAIPGVCLAWSWYWRIAASPSGPPAARFSDFTFSDQFIWLVIGSLAAALAPIPASWQPLLANLALVTAGLYAGRGAAVAWTSVEGFPLVILVLMAVGLAFILPVALGGFAALGVADTWVNFRRRYAVVPGGE